MFANATSLFSGMSLNHFLDDLLERAQHAISNSSEEDLGDEKLAERIGRATVAPLHLRRGEAKTAVRPSDDQLCATLTLPVDGDVRLMQFQTERPLERRVSAQVTDHLSWASGRRGGSSYQNERLLPAEDSEPKVAGVVVEETFPLSGGPDQVRAWASGLADWIEDVLAEVNRTVERHNAVVEEEVPTMVAARLEVLHAAKRWGEQLEGGV